MAGDHWRRALRTYVRAGCTDLTPVRSAAVGSQRDLDGGCSCVNCRPRPTQATCSLHPGANCGLGPPRGAGQMRAWRLTSSATILASCAACGGAVDERPVPSPGLAVGSQRHCRWSTCTLTRYMARFKTARARHSPVLPVAPPPFLRLSSAQKHSDDSGSITSMASGTSAQIVRCLNLVNAPVH